MQKIQSPIIYDRQMIPAKNDGSQESYCQFHEKFQRWCHLTLGSSASEASPLEAAGRNEMQPLVSYTLFTINSARFLVEHFGTSTKS